MGAGLKMLSTVLGVITGGGITFFTTTYANWRKEKNDRERQRLAGEADREQKRLDQLRDVAIRFVQSVAKHSVIAVKAENQSPELIELVQRLKDGEDLATALTAINLRGADSSDFQVNGPTAQVEALVGLVGGLQAAQEAVSDTHALVSEMRLCLPNHLVNLAEVVSMVSYLLHMTSNFPENQRLPATALNTVLAAFVRAVRKEMSLDRYEPQGITLTNLSQKVQDILGE